MKRRVWTPPPDPMPKRPYRDTVLFYGALAIALVVVAILTGGDIVKALVVAVLFFVAATAWTWRYFRNRIRESERT